MILALVNLGVLAYIVILEWVCWDSIINEHLGWDLM